MDVYRCRGSMWKRRVCRKSLLLRRSRLVMGKRDPHLLRSLYRPTAYHFVAYEDHRRLAGGDGALRRVELHANTAVGEGSDGRGDFGCSVADLGVGAEGRGAHLAPCPVHVVGGKLGGE